jgi:hypothetical protein
VINMSDQTIHNLYQAIRAFLAAADAEVAGFSGAPLPAAPAISIPAPCALPPNVDLTVCLSHANDLTRPLVERLLAAEPWLHWQQTYSEAEVGANFLANYGWCHLAGVGGPILVPGVRIFLGYWGPGLDYQLHWHAPEELYLPLAGRALFRSEGCDPRWVGPGDAVFHKSNQPHATEMGTAPFLALILWRGVDLAVDLTITPRKT